MLRTCCALGAGWLTGVVPQRQPQVVPNRFPGCLVHVAVVGVLHGVHADIDDDVPEEGKEDPDPPLPVDRRILVDSTGRLDWVPRAPEVREARRVRQLQEAVLMTGDGKHPTVRSLPLHRPPSHQSDQGEERPLVL